MTTSAASVATPRRAPGARFRASARIEPRPVLQAAAESTNDAGSSAASPLLFAVITLVLMAGSAADQTLAMPLVGLVLLVLIGVGIVKPRVALFVVFGLSIFFEPGNADPLQAAGDYFQRDLQGAFGLTGVQFTGIEVVQLTALLSSLTGTLAGGKKVRAGEMKVQAFFFLGMLLFGYVRGTLGGGLFNFAVWEGRFMIAMMVCFFIAGNATRRRSDVRELINVLVVACAFSAIEGAWRRSALIDTGLLGDAQESWYGHDNVVFWGALVMLVLVQQAFGAPRWQRILGPILAAVTMYTTMVSERRSGYLSLIAAFLVITLVFFIAKRKAFFFIAVPIMVTSAVFLSVTWNASGPLGQPARAIKSINEPDPRDAASNLSRDLEKINIRATIASDPIMGVGFGRPYLLVAQIPDISWWVLWQYATHDQIMWIWLKTGAVGFTGFWILLGTGLSRGAMNARFLRDRDLRVFSVLCMIGVVTAAGFSWVDVGLVGPRVPCFLGTLLGALSVVPRLDRRDVRAMGAQLA
jgi:hypothetical protein